MAIIRPPPRVILYSLVLCILTTVTVFTYTSKYSGKQDKSQETNEVQLIYDPDFYKTTAICPYTENAYQIPYNQTICYEKTMLFWYVPWMHFQVWEKFREATQLRKRKEAEKLENSKRFESNTNYKESEYNREPTGYINIFAEDDGLRDLEEVTKVACTILSILIIVLSIIAFGEYVRERFFGPNEEEFLNMHNGPGMNLRLGLSNGEVLNFDDGSNNESPNDFVMETGQI